MLYPFALTTPNDSGSYNLNSGSGIAFAFDIVSNGSVSLLVVLTAIEQQDSSLRCWVGHDVGGSPLIAFPPDEPLWHAQRIAHPMITVYDKSLSRPQYELSIGVTPGSYFVNILNLTNAKNQFSFLLT
jgi:hypothetical protein